MTEPVARWHVVVPMKNTRAAKSRLGGNAGDRRQLAIVMARDTLCAAVNATQVASLTVVCDSDDDVESFQLPGIDVVVRPGLDLNDAIRAGVEIVRGTDPDGPIATLPGDLPYLRSGELDAALIQASQYERCVVADNDGGGTTLLTAGSGVELKPSYGVGSLQRHIADGAVELPIPIWSGLRRDVDELQDLMDGPALGARTRRTLSAQEQNSYGKVSS